MSNKRNPVVQECCFFPGFFFHTGQYSVVHWKEAKEHLFNSAHSFKHVALLKGMLYVNNTAFFAETLIFLKGVLLL